MVGLRIVCGLLFLLPFPGFSQEANPLMSPQELEIKNVVKKRSFPGGLDEQALKVQSQLPVVTRKMGPTQEIEEADQAPAEHD